MKNICRCGHHKNNHMDWHWFTFTLITKKKCAGQTWTNIDGYDETIACICKDYIPSDNLEFLELKYEKNLFKR